MARSITVHWKERRNHWRTQSQSGSQACWYGTIVAERLKLCMCDIQKKPLTTQWYFSIWMYDIRWRNGTDSLCLLLSALLYTCHLFTRDISWVIREHKVVQSDRFQLTCCRNHLNKIPNIMTIENGYLLYQKISFGKFDNSEAVSSRVLFFQSLHLYLILYY